MRNEELREFISDYLLDKNYKAYSENNGNNKFDNVFAKGFVVIKIMQHGKMLWVKDTNPESKYYHVLYCLTPENKIEADALFRMLAIERKEMGNKAWKELKNSLKNV